MKPALLCVLAFSPAFAGQRQAPIIAAPALRLAPSAAALQTGSAIAPLAAMAIAAAVAQKQQAASAATALRTLYAAGSSNAGPAGAPDPANLAAALDGAKRHRVVLIPGDGIGPEVTEAARRVVDASGVKIDWEVLEVGQAAVERHGTPLPQEAIDAISRVRLVLKGPLQTQTGGGFRSLNLTLRQLLNLYGNFRPARSLPGLKSLYKGVDLIVIRENLEDLYVGLEREVEPGKIESLRIITYEGSARVARYAFETARRLGRKRVTAIHKGNIIKMGDGLFLKAVRDVAAQYPDIEYQENIVDATAHDLVRDHKKFDVLLATNVFGDILSDLTAALVGGLGVAPSANIGDDAAMFEAVHGTAPTIAGKGVANPTALIQSAALMLHHLGEDAAAALIEKALLSVLSKKKLRTGDLGGEATTRSFTDSVVKAMGRLSRLSGRR